MFNSRGVVYPFMSSKGLCHLEVPGNGSLSPNDVKRLQAMIAELVVETPKEEDV